MTDVVVGLAAAVALLALHLGFLTVWVVILSKRADREEDGR